MRSLKEAIRRTRSGVAFLDADLLLAERDDLRRRLACARGWLRHWLNDARDEHLHYMVPVDHLRAALNGEKPPRKGRVK